MINELFQNWGLIVFFLILSLICIWWYKKEKPNDTTKEDF
jgi:cbb3-type cytochrome oxidase subunit 3